MSEIKAMVLVGVGILVVFIGLSVGLVLLGGGGDLIAMAMVLCAALNSMCLTKVIKHYNAQAERRKREEIILSR
jgi:hypothetical protein